MTYYSVPSFDNNSMRIVFASGESGSIPLVDIMSEASWIAAIQPDCCVGDNRDHISAGDSSDLGGARPSTE